MEAKSQKKTSKKEITKKISDTNTPSNGRSQLYWLKRGYINRLKGFRKPLLNIHSVIDITNIDNSVINKFKLKGLEFGNWLNNEDKYNYVSSLVMALYDLNKILGFNYNLGLDRHLSVAFGARGRGKALAHFEPWSNVINLTRYDKDTTSANKNDSFSHTGGVGSFAHEYGHFLDYFFGGYIDRSRDHRSLTIGDGANSHPKANNYPKGSLRALTNDLIIAIIYKSPGRHSDYYKKLLTSELRGQIYWFRHNELFARAFEQYIGHKLERSGIINKFLSKNKYTSKAYMGTGDLMRIIPLFDRLIKQMAIYVKQK